MPFVPPARSRHSLSHAHALRGPVVALRGTLAALCGPFAAISGPGVAFSGTIYVCPSWPPLVRARRGPKCVPLVAPLSPF
eukprot:7808704-Pyramimonas_sp.AAC.1